MRPWVLRVSATAVLLTLAGCTATSSSYDPSDPRTDTSHALLAKATGTHEPGCSAAVGSDGKVIWADAVGLADLDPKKPLTTISIVDFASISKQFTASAALLLAEQKRLTLDQTVAAWIPNMPTWANTVTIDELIHHTSAIPDYVPLMGAAGFAFGDSSTQQDAITVIAGTQLDGQPGTYFKYSNSNYVLLAEIMQRAVGMPFAEYIEQTFFDPLHVHLVDDPVLSDPKLATSYGVDGDDFTAEHSGWAQVGDIGVHGTPSAMVEWLDNYRTGKVGGAKLQADQLVDDGLGADYGAGIELGGDGSIGHSGAWLGFVSRFEVSADRHTEVVVACNRSDADPAKLAARLMKIWG